MAIKSLTLLREVLSVMRVSASAAVLAVACAAGYMILHSPGSPAPQPKLSAATHVRSAQAGLANGGAATRSARLKDRALAHPGSAQATLPVTGWMVTAVGDSVMLAAAPELQAALPGIYVDAVAGRQMSAGLAEVRMIAAAGGLRRVVLVGLGTSGTVSASQINKLRAVIGPDRWLVLVNTYGTASSEQAVNAAIAKAVRLDPQVLLVDWHSAIKKHANLLRADQVRPLPSGGALYARVVKAVLETIT